MLNLQELRTELSEVFVRLKEGDLKAADAKEMNNAAGKIINSAKVELEYYALRDEKPNIPFISGDMGEGKPGDE
jgi:hypothetical protein